MSLEIYTTDDGSSKVRCQQCGAYFSIVGKLQKPKTKTDRIGILEKRISYLEKYPRSNNSAAAKEIKQAKEELTELLKEEEIRDKLRCLPLYSCRATGFKWVCGPCYDYFYQIAEQEQRKKQG